MFPIDNGMNHRHLRYEPIGNGDMSQHFLLDAKARTLTLAKVMRLSDQEAYDAFKAIRFSENDGNAFCVTCGGTECYEYKSERLFKCKACGQRFSLTSKTIFASRKLAHRDILAAIAIFMNGAKGHPALQLSRDLGVQYKTAFVLSHKIREALASQAPRSLSGTVEIDGAFFGGYIRPANHKEDRIDRRLKEHQTGKRKCVVVMRERNGRTATQVFKSEDEAIPAITATVQPGSTIHADEASAWDVLHAHYAAKRVNHSLAYSMDGACTNQAESYFSRLRRAEIGVHHHIRRHYLNAYASEMAWREDHRRESNGAQYVKTVHAATHHPVSRQWKGYWQRRAS
jgi:transposase-like protein